MSNRRSVLLTGATGYLGSLIAATLLANEEMDLVLPVRAGNDLDTVVQPIQAELEIEGVGFSPSFLDRLHLVQLPPFDALDELGPAVRDFGVDEIIHCAGCLDYFDRPTLETVNVDFTANLLAQARAWNIRRFTYMSTAFSCGYTDAVVSEKLHEEPKAEPTEYTRTKRAAEALVVGSGMPYLILRPSVVIGDSGDGHYSGKRYGLYQLWSGMERLLCRTWYPDLHALAPEQPLNLIHQDAFQKIFLAAFRMLPDNSILNLVSDHDRMPNLRDLWDSLITGCLRPQIVYYYQKMSDIPIREINTKQRALLGLASVNLEIASHHWRFETTNLRSLQAKGLEFPKTTLETVTLCQQRFIENSLPIQEFLEQNKMNFATNIQYVRVQSGEERMVVTV